MSLESAIAEMTAALNANTAALLGKAASAATAATSAATTTTETKKGPGRPPKDKSTEAAYTPKYDKAAMQAAMQELREAQGLDVAKGIVKNVGKADKMGDISDPKLIDAVYEAAKAAMEADEEEGEEM